MGAAGACYRPRFLAVLALVVMDRQRQGLVCSGLLHIGASVFGLVRVRTVMLVAQITRTPDTRRVAQGTSHHHESDSLCYGDERHLQPTNDGAPGEGAQRTGGGFRWANKEASIAPNSFISQRDAIHFSESWDRYIRYLSSRGLARLCGGTRPR